MPKISYILMVAFISLWMISCSSSNSCSGYYQGTFTSSHSGHPSGNGKVAIAENENGSVNISLEAVDFIFINIDNVNAYRDDDDLFTIYLSKSGLPSIYGSMSTISNHLTVNCTTTSNIHLEFEVSK